MFITVPILKASLLKEASSALHITTRFAVENDSDDSLGDAKPNHSRRFDQSITNFSSELKNADRYNESKGFSAWGVYTPN